MGTAPKGEPSLSERLLALPETVVGEIIAGELVVSPRPSGRHLLASSVLSRRIGSPFSDGIDGPGGWWILEGPELEFEAERQHYVPDLAGWRKERLPEVPEGHIFTVTPDWVCEIVSPSSRRYDRVEKFNVYAKHGVGYYWVVDPEARSLEAYRSSGGHWVSVGAFSRTDKVRVAPFEDVEIDLALLWPSPAG